jgi:HlyD family secretion protein
LRAQVEQAQMREQAARADVASLTVRAGAPGIVQSVAVDPGARVAQGAELARIADVRTLKVVLQVPEGSVHDITPGMRTRVNASGGTMIGSVSRIAPLAQNGSVAVDITFAGAPPAGSRPDANVSGAIELSRQPHALTIARPAGAADGSTIVLFKLVDGGNRAVRVRVRLGGGSTDRVAVVSGLAPGDSAIVSDMSTYADRTEIRIR